MFRYCFPRLCAIRSQLLAFRLGAPETGGRVGPHCQDAGEEFGGGDGTGGDEPGRWTGEGCAEGTGGEGGGEDEEVEDCLEEAD